MSFGLVNVPIQLYAAVRAGEKIHFHLLHSTDHSPVRYERICKKDGAVVPWGEIVKGYEYSKGQFVELTDDDFKSAALEASKLIEIRDFVAADEIDPRYFETPYYLLPTKNGTKGYALLREAIRNTGTVGIGTITMRANTHHLAGVKVVGPALVLEIMRFQHELVDAADFTFPSTEDLRPQELKMAEQLIGHLTESFDPAKYTDDYRANLMRVIQAKLKGKPIEVTPPEEPQATPVMDLIAKLQESLANAAAKRDRAGPAATSRRRGRTARRRSA